MRHFVVLGFKTTVNSEEGEQVHLGSDRGEAIEVANAVDERFVRKQLYELAVPHLSRHFEPVEKPTPAKRASTNRKRAEADVSS